MKSIVENGTAAGRISRRLKRTPSKLSESQVSRLADGTTKMSSQNSSRTKKVKSKKTNKNVSVEQASVVPGVMCSPLRDPERLMVPAVSSLPVSPTQGGEIEVATTQSAEKADESAEQHPQLQERALPVVMVDEWENKWMHLWRGVDTLERLQWPKKSMVPVIHSLPQVGDTEFVQLLEDLHVQALPLHALPPANLWLKDHKYRWRYANELFAPKLKFVLDWIQVNPSSTKAQLALLQVVLERAELPARVLLDMIGEKKEASNSFGSTFAKAKAALRLMHMGRPSKAWKRLHSNGIAEHSPETLRVLQSMHPQSSHSSENCRVGQSELKITTQSARAALYKEIARDEAGCDFYGYRADLIWLFRGKSEEALESSVDPFQQFVRYVCHLTRPQHVSDALAMVLTCGELFGLHKLTPNEQAERAQAGLQPSLRPITMGVFELKKANWLVLTHPQAIQEYKEVFGNIQMGLGVSRGVEKVGHLANVWHKNGFVVCQTDVANAFNAASRHKILKYLAEDAPRIAPMLQRYYAISGMNVVQVGNGQVAKVMSTEGVRMGCTMGSAAFSIAIQRVYSKVQNVYPNAVSVAIIDDFTFGVPTVENGERRQIEHVIKQITDMYALLQQELEEQLELKLALPKCKILLPTSMGSLKQDHMASLPVGIQVTSEGLVVCGTPIGSDSFIRHHFSNKAKEARAAAEALALVGNLQVAEQLYRWGGARSRLAFLTQVIDTSIIMDLLVEHDRLEEDFILSLMHVESKPPAPTCSAERMEKAKIRLGLPLRLGGRGHIKLHSSAPVAFYASLATCVATCALLKKHVQSLDSHNLQKITAVYALMTNQLGPREGWSQATITCVGEGPNCVVEGSFYESLLDEHPGYKIQKKIMQAVHDRTAEQYFAKFAPADRADPLKQEVDCDYIQALALNHHSTSALLMANLSFKRNRLSHQQASIQARAHLALPQQPSSTLFHSQKHSYRVEQCRGFHANSGALGDYRTYVDLHGNHANSNCIATTYARSLSHILVRDVLHDFCLEAGLRVRKEPSTHTHVFKSRLEREQLNKLLPGKHLSVAVREKINDIRVQVKAASQLPENEKVTKTEAQWTAFNDLCQERGDQLHMLRGDLLIESDHDQRITLVDVTGTHSTAQSHRDDELTRTNQRNARKSKVPRETICSYALEKAHQLKTETYAPLLALYELLHVQGQVSQELNFLPAAFTTQGELGAPFLALCALIIHAYSRKVIGEGPTEEGVTPKIRAAMFKTRLYAAIAVAIARGSAERQMRDGKPWISPRPLQGAGAVAVEQRMEQQQLAAPVVA